MFRSKAGLILLGSLCFGGHALAAQEGPPASLAQLDTALAEAVARIDAVEDNLATAIPSERSAFELQLHRRWEEHHTVLGRVVDAVEDAGLEAADSAVVARAAESLSREIAALAARLAATRADLDARHVQAARAAPEERVEHEVEATGLAASIDADMLLLLDAYDWAVALDLEVADGRPAHEAEVVERTESVAALLELALADVEEQSERRSVEGIDTVTVGLRLAAAEERVRGETSSLQAMVTLLGRLGRDPAEYRQLIVSATGRLGTEVLDTEVLGGLFASWGSAARDWVVDNGGLVLLRLVAFVLILFVASRLSHVARAIVGGALERADLSSLIKQLSVSGAGKAVWLVALLIVLWLVGIDLGPALAGLGIAGIVLGFALQDTLSNFAAGLMIMIYRPFDVDDFVTVGGVTGMVRDLTMVSTHIQTLDNKRIIVPNGKVWGDVINNATAEEVRRVDLVFGIHYDDDVDRAISVLEQVLAEDERVLEEPAALVKVGALGDSSVDLLCRPWCRTENYWDVMWDLTRAVKKRFDAEGITIPFPQRDVHVYQERPPGSAGALDGGSG